MRKLTGGPTFTLIKRNYIWNYNFNKSSSSETDQTVREQLLSIQNRWYLSFPSQISVLEMIHPLNISKAMISRLLCHKTLFWRNDVNCVLQFIMCVFFEHWFVNITKLNTGNDFFFSMEENVEEGYGFSSGHVWMLKLDYKENWVSKNWCFWTVVLEKTLESPLDCKEIQPVHPEGDQSWLFIGGTDVEAETLIIWPPDAKSWLIWKDPEAGNDWGQEEKGTTEDEMFGWHHRLDGRGFGWTPGVGFGQWGLACCSPRGRKESDTTEWLDWTELNWMFGKNWPIVFLISTNS